MHSSYPMSAPILPADNSDALVHPEINDCLIAAREFANHLLESRASDDTARHTSELKTLHALMQAFRIKRKLTWLQIGTGTTKKAVVGYTDSLNKSLAKWNRTRATTMCIQRDYVANDSEKLWLSFEVNKDQKAIKHTFEWKIGTKKTGITSLTVEDIQVITGHKSNFGRLDIILTPSHSWLPMLDPPDRPAHVGKYEVRKASHWRDFLNERAAAQPPRPVPIKSYLWHVERCYPYSRNTITGRTQVIVLIRGCGFDDHVATTKQLDKPIWEYGQTLRTHLMNTPVPGFAPHFPLGSANPLSVDVCVVTNDGVLIVRQQELNGPYESAIYGYVDALADVHRLDPHLPSPKDTVFHWGCRLLNLQVPLSGIHWLGVSMDSQDGTVSLLGEVHVNLAFSEIEKRVKEAAEYTHRTQKIAAVPRGLQNTKQWLEIQRKTNTPPRSHVQASIILTTCNLQNSRGTSFRAKSAVVD